MTTIRAMESIRFRVKNGSVSFVAELALSCVELASEVPAVIVPHLLRRTDMCLSTIARPRQWASASGAMPEPGWMDCRIVSCELSGGTHSESVAGRGDHAISACAMVEQEATIGNQCRCSKRCNYSMMTHQLICEYRLGTVRVNESNWLVAQYGNKCRFRKTRYADVKHELAEARKTKLPPPTGVAVHATSDPSGIRTRVLALKGLRPGPLDDGAV